MAAELLEKIIPHAWLPDETLFSLCSRHHKLSGNFIAASTCRQLFGHSSQGAAHDFPSRIGYFSEVTRGQLGCPETIIRYHTILPYYMPFSSNADESAMFDRMAGNSIGGMKYQLGILTSRFRANHPLKACRACLDSDRRRWSTAYWHLQHQLPGVWVCPIHGEMLAISNLKSTGVGRFQWLLPSEQHLLDTPAGVHDSVRLRQLGALACSLWSMPTGMRFDLKKVAATYRQALRDRALIQGRGEGRLRFSEIGEKYATFVEPLRCVDELQALPHSPEAAACEVRRLTSLPRSGQHPLRHLTLIAWLFGEMDGFLAELGRDRTSSVVCKEVPKNVSSKLVVTPVRTKLLELVKAGTAVSTASRQLGIDPKTGMAWLAAEGIETNKRPSLIKGDIRLRLISALRRGVSKQEAAAKGNVSLVSVTRLLDTEVGLREAWTRAKFSKAQGHARTTWTKLISTNPNTGVKAVRLMRPEIYAWLYRNDRDWLVAQSQEMSPVRAVSAARVDWLMRDQALAKTVEAVALEIVLKAPGRKLKLWQLYQRIPDLKAKLGHLDQLPLTQAAIQAALTAVHNEGGFINEKCETEL